MEEITVESDEIHELNQDLKALMSLLFALADAEDGGFIVDSASLNHLGNLAAECHAKVNKIFFRGCLNSSTIIHGAQIIRFALFSHCDRGMNAVSF